LFGDKEEGKGKIFNSISNKEDKKGKGDEDKRPSTIIDDDDEWGAVPAFLRRSKLK